MNVLSADTRATALLPARKRLAPMLISASFGLFVGMSLITHAFLSVLSELRLIDGFPSPYGNALYALIFLLGVVVYLLVKFWTYVAVLTLRIDEYGVRQRQLFRGDHCLRWHEVEEMRESLGRTVLHGSGGERVFIPMFVVKNYGPTIGCIREQVAAARA